MGIAPGIGEHNQTLLEALLALSNATYASCNATAVEPEVSECDMAVATIIPSL
jgi:hypothetical protein